MATEWSDEASIEGDEHEEWLEWWSSRCPDGHPQRVARCLGHREREPGRLQLRVALGGPDNGVCDVIVEEADDAVRIRMFVCYDLDRPEAKRSSEYIDCPVHVYLDKPLGDRTVIDVQTDEPVPLFVPSWE